MQGSNEEGAGLNRLKIKSENAGKVELRVGMRGKKRGGETDTDQKPVKNRSMDGSWSEINEKKRGGVA